MVAHTPPQWPGVNQPFPHRDLARHLFDVAALHARRALTDATDALSILDRAVSAGTAVELLAKAALAHVNPALLAVDREPKSLLHFSGISTVEATKAKTRIAGDCLAVLHQVHPLDYKFDRDGHVFEVRNLAAHLGCVDIDQLDKALTTMVALAEQIISLICDDYDSSLDRTAFWTTDFLPQVDERMKAEAEARRLKLEQLKAAALRELERLRTRGVEDDLLTELADRPPPAYYDYSGDDLDERFERHKCPVCEFDGWLEYSVTRGPVQYDWGDDAGAPITWVDVEYEPLDFVCGVCSLRLGDDLLYVAGVGEYRAETEEATTADLQDAEDAAIADFWSGEPEDEPG